MRSDVDMWHLLILTKFTYLTIRSLNISNWSFTDVLLFYLYNYKVIIKKHCCLSFALQREICSLAISLENLVFMAYSVFYIPDVPIYTLKKKKQTKNT